MKTNFVVLLASLFLALLGAEGVLRLLGRFSPPAYPPVSRSPALYDSAAGFGYALWPSRHLHYSYPPARPRRLSVISNSLGFRNRREFDEPDDRCRLLLAGDSYTFGEGVEASERFSNLLETMEPDWRVDNMGMTGYGPDLMEMALERVVPRARPDLVALLISFDDFRRVRRWYAGMGFAIPRYRLVGERLERIPYPRPRPWDESHLYHAFLRALAREGKLFGPLTDEEWRLNRRILDRVLDLGAEQAFLTVLAYLPGPWKGAVNDRRREWLGAYAREHAVPFLDLSAAIHSADSDSVFLTENSHYSPAGHRIVAEELHGLLRSVLAREAVESRSSGPRGHGRCARATARGGREWPSPAASPKAGASRSRRVFSGGGAGTREAERGRRSAAPGPPGVRSVRLLRKHGSVDDS
ncbi:MAG: SGNH/GDSL hydrolase family protein [Gemmatimonadota bacterium]